MKIRHILDRISKVKFDLVRKLIRSLMFFIDILPVSMTFTTVSNLYSSLFRTASYELVPHHYKHLPCFIQKKRANTHTLLEQRDDYLVYRDQFASEGG